ncbi:uridine kinase family protein [Actinomyces oricola]|uniref:uridine kinase family protein n=1 Tax=Actinomyces oricola TaxID=206043 RepID=UPI000FFEC9AF|nr:hypothetical protein [Actinomyces oricola]
MATDPIAPVDRQRIRPADQAPALQPEEPAVTNWKTTALNELFAHLLALAGTPTGRPAIVAVDGRGAAGKTTLAGALVSAVPGTQVVHVDDLDWNEPLYQWDHVLVAALTELHTTGALDYVPPAWRPHGRSGSVVVQAGTPLVVVEGTGASMRAVTDLLDACVWVQTDDQVAEDRGIQRDIAEGVNGGVEDTVAFWHWWMAGERRFFAADRPWERADVIVSGAPALGVEAGEVAWAEGPLRSPTATVLGAHKH